jgi:hypothetical protein
MNPKRILPTLLSVFLFFSGILINLSLSGTLLWGEIEARIFMQQVNDEDLKIECPLLIAPWETAVIKTVVTNTLTEVATKPQVNAFISHANDMRMVNQMLELEPLESQPLQWTADSADIVFERLILVNIHQRPYRNLPSRQGACSILVFSLFGLSGLNTLILVTSTGVLASLLGMAVFFFLYRPFSKFTQSIVQLNMIFLGLVILGLITALFRFWGFTLFFDATALLVFTTGSVEIFFSRNK